MSAARVKYERKPEVRLKRYIKNHDPKYQRKRKEYSSKPSVLERRKTLNKRRRQLCTTLITLAKQGKLRDENGQQFVVDFGRLLKGEKVVKVDKGGNIHEIHVEDRFDLDDEELDEVIFTDEDKTFLELLEKYKNGDYKILKKIKEIEEISFDDRHNER